jgi:purine-binding chemotaxis protein CheW
MVMQATQRDTPRTASHASDAAHDPVQLVSFMLGAEEFGVDILHVREINRILDITRVPDCTDYVDGIINLRGAVIPILDLRRRFGMPRKEHDKDTRVIVVEVGNRTAGFVVDAVKEVLRIPRGITEPPPAIGGSSSRAYITAIGKLDDRLLILLDLERIVGTDDVLVN